MDQVYFVGKPNDDGRRSVLYRYGNFCYTDLIRVDNCEDIRKLPAVMQFLQSIQGEMAFFSEYDAIPESSPHFTSLDEVNNVIDFLFEEMVGSGNVLEDLAASGEDWLNSDKASVYFELETQPGFSCNGADLFFAKTFQSDVMMTVIFYDGVFYATLSDASAEQALVDTLFPNIYGRQRGMSVRSYDHPAFRKLSVWEASGTVPDPAAVEPSTSKPVETTPSKPFEDISGDGYSQTYVLLRPHNIRIGSYSRKALFRFGNWCYEGEVDFGVDALHLGDVPDVLPALQKQQGNLAYVCDASSMPSTDQFAQIMSQFLAATRFLQEEMVAVEPILQRLSETAETAWIDQDWAASFFEMQFNLTDVMKPVEMIAAKCYFPGGIVLHTVLFGGSIYCVLADSVEDLPLLDVAFPDVTAKCRGVQVKAYNSSSGSGLRPRRLMVWEGRRKGCPGVGWGTGALIAEGVGQSIRDKARKRAEDEAGKVAAAVATGGFKSAEVKKPSAAAEPASSSKEAEPEPKLTAAPQQSDSKLAEPEPKPTPAVVNETGGSGGGGKEADEDDDISARLAAAQLKSGGSGSGGSSSRAPVGGALGVKAPHHLPPMQAIGGRLGKLPLGASSSPAPWDSTGKPLFSKK